MMKTQVYNGDCLEILKEFGDESVDLIYLDPPFFTQKTHTLRTRERKQEFSFKDLWSSHQITRQRLEQPVKTESRLLQQGRDSYRNADEEVLSLLHGVEFAPVQRNKGIDAVLKKDLNGKPILVRVQRADESILEAANRLYKASKRKGAAAMFVIATQRGGYFEFENQFPQGVTIIDAPALAITDSLAQFNHAFSE